MPGLPLSPGVPAVGRLERRPILSSLIVLAIVFVAASWAYRSGKRCGSRRDLPPAGDIARRL